MILRPAYRCMQSGLSTLPLTPHLGESGESKPSDAEFEDPLHKRRMAAPILGQPCVLVHAMSVRAGVDLWRTPMPPVI